MKNLMQWTTDLLGQFGLYPGSGELGHQLVAILLILLIAVSGDFIFRYVILNLVKLLVHRTRAQWDDLLFDHKVLRKITPVIPATLVYIFINVAFPAGSESLIFFKKMCLIYIIAVFLNFVHVFLKVLFEISSQRETFRDRPLKGLLQVIQICLFFIGIILIISVVIDRSPSTLFAGLGASAAILMLVFKDSIMGFISGIQLSANNMLRPGDWITVSKYGANGIVEEVTMNTVKVRNFDNTIVTVPPLRW